jgi:hypothetical protein
MDERCTVNAYLLHMSMDHFLLPPFGAREGQSVYA